MMKRWFITLFAVCCGFACTYCDTAANVDDPDKFTFVKFYGRDGDQTGVDLEVLDDGSIMLLGNTRTTSAKRIYLVKIDALGNVIWDRVLGGIADVAIDIEPAGDNFVILARTELSASDHDFKLLLIDDQGLKLDSTVQGYAGKKEDPRSITPLQDGGFVVTGATQYDEDPNFNPPDPDAYANVFHWRCDSRFNFVNAKWRNLFGDKSEFDGAVKAFEVSNAAIRFYVCGFTSAPHFGKSGSNLNLRYYGLSDDGEPPSQVGYAGDYTQNTTLNAAIREPAELGGGYFQLGTRANTSGTVTMHVTKLRPQLTFTDQDRLLDKEIDIIPRPLEAVAAATVVAGAPQGYLLLAEELRNLGTKNISLTKIDQRGTVAWSISLGSEEENDEAAAVSELPDGRILVLGTVEIGDNQSKMTLFKLNSDGRLYE